MTRDKPLDLEQSVAGEEDPGASIDLATASPGARAGPKLGDEAPPGTPGTGEKPCPQCGGSGRTAAGSCPYCLGTGKVNVGIGGA